jgi:putative protease
MIAAVRQRRGRVFVLNAPWQMGFFENPKPLDLWAGPFCNIANPMAVYAAGTLGFKGCIASPELGAGDYGDLARRSCLPLGIVLAGSWPLCISRVVPEAVSPAQAILSPKGEAAWTVRYGENTWVYPNWRLIFAPEKKALIQAGYRLFVTLDEPVPQEVRLKERPGWWNWKVGLS